MSRGARAEPRLTIEVAGALRERVVRDVALLLDLGEAGEDRRAAVDGVTYVIRKDGREKRGKRSLPTREVKRAQTHQNPQVKM